MQEELKEKRRKFTSNGTDLSLPTHCRYRKLLLPSITPQQQTKTIGRPSLDEESALRRGLYLEKHKIHNRQTSMSFGGIRTRNPKQASGRRPTSQTAQPLTSATALSVHHTVTTPDDSSPRSVKSCHLFASQTINPDADRSQPHLLPHLSGSRLLPRSQYRSLPALLIECKEKPFLLATKRQLKLSL